MFTKIRQAWQSDTLLRRVVKNSAYLSSSNTVAAGLSFLQGILTARLLGVDGLGQMAAIMTFVTAVNNLLSFRMSEVAVKHANAALASQKQAEASAIFKGAAITEILTSLLAFSVMLLLAPWAAAVFVQDPAKTGLVTFYGLVILSNLLFETSRGVLQSSRRFGQIAAINLAQSILVFSIIFIAFLTSRASLPLVLGAYLAGKTLAGVAIVIFALRALNQTLPGWLRVPLKAFTGWNGFYRFALNTNLNGTVNLFVRDNIPLYISALTSPTQVGYFRVAFGFTNLLMLPIEPLIWPTYTEITRSIAARSFEATRQLLRRVTKLAAGWVFLAGGLVALLGWWLIPLLYGSQYAPAYPAALLLILGYGTASILGWNRPLMLALGYPNFPLWVAALAGCVELALLFWLTPVFGYLAAAAVLSAYLVATVCIIAWRGISILNRQAAA